MSEQDRNNKITLLKAKKIANGVKFESIRVRRLVDDLIDRQIKKYEAMKSFR